MAHQRCLDLTVGYVKERQQFGVPIGSFQAIQHKLAEMSLELERAIMAAAKGGLCGARIDHMRGLLVFVDEGLDAEAAGRLIMAAREIWFQDQA